jgi:hypothetical protein
VHKIRKIKGKKPPKRRTDRTETDNAIRHGIVVYYIYRDTNRDIARFYKKDKSLVTKTINRAKRRAKRDRVPL